MIPDFQAVLLPLLRVLSDEKEKTTIDTIESLASHFNLTEDERKELLPSGKQAIFDNRVGWARTYLKKAGIIESPRRGIVVITDRGIELLKSGVRELRVKDLKKYPEFVEFHTMKRNDDSAQNQNEIDDEQFTSTPEEMLEKAYQSIRSNLAQEILQKVKTLPPLFFEKLVVDLLVRMGYGGSIKDAGKAIGKSGDEGIDGMIKEDKLGLDVVYIQAKRWAGSVPVGRPEIQKFVGALAGQGAKKGIFITTAYFSRDAIEYTPKNETKIVLIDGEKLAQLMIDYNLGVSIENSYEIKKIDNDFFGES